MASYAESLGKPTGGLLLLGDNFYGKMKDGLKSARWQSGFSNVFPAKTYPGPCWAVLGNHDYHDTAGGEQIQLGYAASLDRKTRWTMPGKFYRVDLPLGRPQVTFLMIDTNWESFNRRGHGDKPPCWMTADEQAAQKAWLETQLGTPRAPFTIVIGHHPVYSEGNHGDTPELVQELGPLFEKAGVHLYICGHDHDLQHSNSKDSKPPSSSPAAAVRPFTRMTKFARDRLLGRSTALPGSRSWKTACTSATSTPMGKSSMRSAKASRTIGRSRRSFFVGSSASGGLRCGQTA